jgi:hypothetical protein
MNWIPIGERLPEPYQTVIIYIHPQNSHFVEAGYLGMAHENQWHWGQGWWPLNTVTHWMPMPEPPYADDNN